MKDGSPPDAIKLHVILLQLRSSQCEPGMSLDSLNPLPRKHCGRSEMFDLCVSLLVFGNRFTPELNSAISALPSIPCRSHRM